LLVAAWFSHDDGAALTRARQAPPALARRSGSRSESFAEAGRGMTTGRVRWGVLGAARIALTKVVPAMKRSGRVDVVAIASRDADRARQAADSLAIPQAYGSYEALLADPGVDAIYNPLPNHLHLEWTRRAAEAGKHVLCEKPIGLDAAEAVALVDVRDRTGVKIQEAFMVRTHPQWIAAVGQVQAGRIGEVRAVTGAFSFFNDDPRNIRNVRAFGGGALLDIGCYLVHTARWIYGREPARVAAAIERDPRSDVDRLTSILLDFGAGHAVGTCSTQLAPYQRVQILGTSGRIEVEIPFNAPADRPCRVFVGDGTDATGTSAEVLTFDTCDQYTREAELFSEAILDSTPQPLPLEDSVANMRVLDAIVRAGESGRFEKIETIGGRGSVRA
jgi:predicted dehydrogenase